MTCKLSPIHCTTLKFDHLTFDNFDMFQTLYKHLLVLYAITDTPSVGNTGVRVRPGAGAQQGHILTFKHQYIGHIQKNIETMMEKGLTMVDTFKTAKRNVCVNCK